METNNVVRIVSMGLFMMSRSGRRIVPVSTAYRPSVIWPSALKRDTYIDLCRNLLRQPDELLLSWNNVIGYADNRKGYMYCHPDRRRPSSYKVGLVYFMPGRIYQIGVQCSTHEYERAIDILNNLAATLAY